MNLNPILYFKHLNPMECLRVKTQYAERIIESVIEQIEPKLKELNLLANQTRSAKKEAQNALKTASEARKALSDLQEHKTVSRRTGRSRSNLKEYFDKTFASS